MGVSAMRSLPVVLSLFPIRVIPFHHYRGKRFLNDSRKSEEMAEAQC